MLGLIINSGSALADDWLVIRAGQCSAEAFINGGGGDDKYITSLSVNRVKGTIDDMKAKFPNRANNAANYYTGIQGYGQYCVAREGELEMIGATLTADKQKDNKFHYLLSGKPDDIVKKLTKKSHSQVSSLN